MGARKKSIDDVSTVNLVAPTLSPDGVVVFVLTGDAKGTAYGFAIGDLDRDGRPDIAMARSDAPNVVYFARQAP